MTESRYYEITLCNAALGRTTSPAVGVHGEWAQGRETVARGVDQPLRRTAHDSSTGDSALAHAGTARHQMTHDNTITEVPRDTIRVGERHRKDMGDLDALASSVAQEGLLQPIGVTEDNTLVFGER